MTQPDLARLEGLRALARETLARKLQGIDFVNRAQDVRSGAATEIPSWVAIDLLAVALKDSTPALLARVRELTEALGRIASEHIRLPDQPHGHIWHRDCDACNARQIAQDALNRSIPDADR